MFKTLKRIRATRKSIKKIQAYYSRFEMALWRIYMIVDPEGQAASPEQAEAEIASHIAEIRTAAQWKRENE